MLACIIDGKKKENQDCVTVIFFCQDLVQKTAGWLDNFKDFKLKPYRLKPYNAPPFCFRGWNP